MSDILSLPLTGSEHSRVPHFWTLVSPGGPPDDRACTIPRDALLLSRIQQISHQVAQVRAEHRALPAVMEPWKRGILHARSQSMRPKSRERARILGSGRKEGAESMNLHSRS